jgi:hypothetical protein
VHTTAHHVMAMALISYSQLCPIEMSVYGYRPNLAVNIMFVALFSLATFVHTYLGLRWKTPGFTWCLILSCTLEIGGYVCRIMLWRNPWSFGAFITQISQSLPSISVATCYSVSTIVLITQAPVFYCAAIYVTLGQRSVLGRSRSNTRWN